MEIQRLEAVYMKKHFRQFDSNNIYDRHIREHVCRFIDKTNTILYDFRFCDCSTLVDILRTFCMPFMAMNYGT